MRLKSQTYHQLVLEDRPWFVAGFCWLVGGVTVIHALFGTIEDSGLDQLLGRALLFAMGAGVCALAWVAFPLQDIVLDRRRGIMARKIRRVLQTRYEELALDTIVRAKPGGSWSESDFLERIELVLVDGIKPLEWGYSSGSRQQLVRQVNDWLASDEDLRGR